MGRGGEGAEELLARVAARYQAEAVVPRCARCREPCCRLATLALEFTWERLRAVWRIEESRAAFDARLARGEGPPELKAEGGLYYAHGRPCPAYRGGVCAVYGTPAKPPGCTDFPVYVEDGALVADRRCEAVDLDDLEARLLAALGPRGRLRRRVDRAFPTLTRLEPRPPAREEGRP